jgi:ribonucrease Y
MSPSLLMLVLVCLVLAVVLVGLGAFAFRLQKQLWLEEKKFLSLQSEREAKSKLSEDLQERENSVVQKESELEAEKLRILNLSPESLNKEIRQELASKMIVQITEDGQQLETELQAGAEARAQKVVIDTMERHAMKYVCDATTSLVVLPSEDVKGRIIGREGRNIRAFEQITGVDVVIDETPEAVTISSFDPIRRETARLTLMNLIVDGRIHPAKIEELHEKSKLEIERLINDSGRNACDSAGVTDLPKPVITTLGRLRFRTSYAQNVLDHSVEVAKLASNLGAELGLNVKLLKKAGLLHDIGKALEDEAEGPHALTGMNFLSQFNFEKEVLNAVGAHHHDIEPICPEAQIIIVADTLSAARPGARRENLDNYIKRLASLEKIANSFKGVERSYAVQAGRELRLIVQPDLISDSQAKALGRDVAKRIGAEVGASAQMKIVVIRESRFTEIVK